MQARPNRESEFGDRGNDRGGASHRTRRPVETREKAVTGRVDFTSTKTDELSADKCVMSLDKIAPARVAQFRRAFSGADDVGEEKRREDAFRLGGLPRTCFPRAGKELCNRRKELVLIDGPDNGVTGRHLDEPCAWDPTGDVAARIDRPGQDLVGIGALAVSAARPLVVHHERRGTDRREASLTSIAKFNSSS